MHSLFFIQQQIISFLRYLEYQQKTSVENALTHRLCSSNVRSCTTSSSGPYFLALSSFPFPFLHCSTKNDDSHFRVYHHFSTSSYEFPGKFILEKKHGNVWPTAGIYTRKWLVRLPPRNGRLRSLPSSQEKATPGIRRECNAEFHLQIMDV